MSLFNRMRTQKLLSFTLVAFTLCIGIVIGTLISVNWGASAAQGSQAAPGATPLVIPSPVEMSNTFSQIAKQVEPAVVNISTSYAPRAAARTQNRRQAVPDDEEDQGGMEDFFNRFFGSPFGGPGVPDSPNNRRSEGLGSGVLIDAAGYILTNNHVVDRADRIKVKFAGDVNEYDATVVGTDEQTDLAVIRVEGKTNLHPAKIGNSDAVQVGDWVVAIGSPFGFQATVTAGIVSAKERDIPGGGSTQYQHFLQTDAAINPGNSGGPLLNVRGEVVGINTAIASRTGGYQGIGFALPINTAASVYNQIIKSGKVTRSSIGIEYNANERQSLALLKANGVTEGVFVGNVQAGGPAEKAGVQPGDIIVSLNGKPVRNGGELVNSIVSMPLGSTVELGVVRGGKRESFKVVTADIAQIFPDRYGSPETSNNARPGETSAKFGISIQSLTDQWRQGNNLKQTGGVRVVSVEPDSFGEDAGLLPNDVIVSINRKDVNSVEDVTRMQATLKPGDAVQFRVLRRGGRAGEWTPLFLAGIIRNESK